MITHGGGGIATNSVLTFPLQHSSSVLRSKSHASLQLVLQQIPQNNSNPNVVIESVSESSWDSHLCSLQDCRLMSAHWLTQSPVHSRTETQSNCCIHSSFRRRYTETSENLRECKFLCEGFTSDMPCHHSVPYVSVTGLSASRRPLRTPPGKTWTKCAQEQWVR